LFFTRKLLILSVLHRDIHRPCQILHERNLSNQIYKRFTAKYSAKELSRVRKPFLRLGVFFAMFVVLRPQVRIAEDLVCFADGLEAFVCCVVAGVLVCDTLDEIEDCEEKTYPDAL
jgi:hypothetical protein